MNGQNEQLTFGFDGAPLFTYAMIGLTTIVIAFATMTDNDSNLPSFLKSDYTNTTAVGGSYPAENHASNKQIKKKETTKNRKTIRKR